MNASTSIGYNAKVALRQHGWNDVVIEFDQFNNIVATGFYDGHAVRATGATLGEVLVSAEHGRENAEKSLT